MGNIHVSQGDIRFRQPIGVIGSILLAGIYNQMDYLVNDDPQAEEVWTLTVDSATDDTEYTLTITDDDTNDSWTVSYTSGTGSTTTTIATGLKDAWNQDQRSRGIAEAASAAAIVTITGVWPNRSFTVAESSADLSIVNTTSAAAASSVTFGRAVIALSNEAAEGVRNGVLAQASKLTAQVDTITPVYAAGEKYLLTITIDELSYSVAVDEDTNLATTCTAIAAAVNAVMPANTVIADGSSGTTVTLTAELAGKPFRTTYGSETGGNISIAYTTSGLATDFHRAFAGIATYSYEVEGPSRGTAPTAYPANFGMNVLRKGQIVVANSQDPSYGDFVYVELSTSGSEGKFYNDSGAGRVKLPASVARWVDTAQSDDALDSTVAILELL